MPALYFWFQSTYLLFHQAIPEAQQPPVDSVEPVPASDPVLAAEAEEAAPKLKFFAEGQSTPKKEVSAIPPAPVIPPAQEPAEPASEAKSSAPAEKAAPAKPAAPAKKDPPKQVAKKESAKAADGKFTVQVSAFQSRAQANHLVSNLKNKGYDAYIAQATIPGKGVWYRVRIGKFPSREAAQTTANTLKRKEGISTYVTLAQ